MMFLVAICPVKLCFREIISQKDDIIKSQQFIIESLKEQMRMLMGFSGQAGNHPVLMTALASGSAATASVYHRDGTTHPNLAYEKREKVVLMGPEEDDESGNSTSVMTPVSKLGDGSISTLKTLETAEKTVEHYITPTQVAAAVHQAKANSIIEDVLSLDARTTDSAGKWKTVSHKRTQRRRQGRPVGDIVGTKQSDGVTGLKAADGLCFLHLYKLHIDTTVEDVREYLLPHFPEAEVESLNSRHPESYKSFKIRVKKSNRDAIVNADFWPAGVRVNNFFLQRSRANLAR